MLMDNPLEILGITDSNIKITRFSAESVNGEKRNVIEARLTYNVDRCSYCESERVVRNGSKILHTRLTELQQEHFEMKLYKQRYLCKECLKTWSARTDIVEEGHTLSHQLKRSVLHMAREKIKMGPDCPIPLSLIIVQRFDWQAFDCVHDEQQNDDFNRPADDFLWKSLSQKAIQGTCRFGLEVHQKDPHRVEEHV